MTETKTVKTRLKTWLTVAVAIQATVFWVSCGSKRASSTKMSDAEKIVADVLIQAALTPSQSAIVWVADKDGQRASYWVRGNAVRIEYAGARPEMVIPVEGALWRWSETLREVAVCDCDAWAIEDWEGECPEKADTAMVADIDAVDLVTGELRAVYRPSRPESKAGFPLSDLAVTASPVASVGPYLFVKYSEEGAFCRADRVHKKEGYIVFDLKRGEKTEILNDKDREKIKALEQKAAFESMGESLGPASDSSDLGYVAVEPGFDSAFSLRVSYVFAEKTELEDSAAARGTSYSQTVAIAGDTIPEALAPFTVPPAVVNAFAKAASGVYPGGWGLVTGSDEQMAAIWTAFSSEQPAQDE